jgi:hypothetical protein
MSDYQTFWRVLMGGISAQTGNNILYGTDGYLTVAGTDIGATEDAISIEWSIEQYYPDLAQARGPVAGTGRVVKGDFKIKCKITEWQYAVLSLFCGSYGASSDATSEKIGGGNIGTVTEVTSVIVTGITRNDGKAFKATIPQAYVELGNIELAESKETVLEVTFMGLYTLTNPRALPGYIQFQR